MPNPNPWIVFAGGGTGGHLYPGIAVAESVRRLCPDAQITFFTTDKTIDRTILAPYGFEQVTQTVQPWAATPWRWPAFLKAYFASVKQAKSLFKARKPGAVLGLGGYAAAPAVIAGVKVGCYTAVFNPDALPGRANRRLIPKVNTAFTQWDQTLQKLGRPSHARVVGCPVRSEFEHISREEGCKACGLDPARNVLLITGASQGASTVNEMAIGLTDLFLAHEDWQILHITGRNDYDGVRRVYGRAKLNARVIDFTPKIAWAMAAADLVISRAGASTIAEICALGIPSILMPYPFDRQQHQKANAQIVVDAEGGFMVEDRKNAEENIRAIRPYLTDLMTSHERRRRMGRAAHTLTVGDAADAIASTLLDYAGRVE
jgi:UDP-N-acetylglucosamine--N-acetylmuramyl-(pentapeptide) pyrophosphoryl-undecaprenol N-acetylglucosamine transferase